LAVRTTGHAVG